MSKEAMKQALEALTFADEFIGMKPYEHVAEEAADGHRNLLEAIKALEEALAKQEQDSTCNETLRAQGKAYPRTCKKCGFGPCINKSKQEQGEPHSWYSAQEDEWMTDKTRKDHERLNSYTHKVGGFDLPLYTTPQQRKCDNCEEFGECCQKQKQGKTAASKTPLTDALNFFTDAERLEIWKKHNVSDSQIAVITQKVLSKFYATPLAKQEHGEQHARDAITWTPETGYVFKKKDQGEPVAYMWPTMDSFTSAEDVGSIPNWTDYYTVPLYTTPQQRKPLTDEQLKPHYQNQEWLEGVRFAEAAHGIKGEA